MKIKAVTKAAAFIVGALLIGVVSLATPTNSGTSLSLNNLVSEANAGCEIEDPDGTVINCTFAFKSCRIEFDGNTITCNLSKISE